MKLITLIWVLFAALFLVLAIFHLCAAQQAMPHFTAKPTAGIVSIWGVPYAKSGFKKFIPEMNSFIDKQNESARNQNLLTAFGYFLACITAIFSAILSDEKYAKKMDLFLEKHIKRKPK